MWDAFFWEVVFWIRGILNWTPVVFKKGPKHIHLQRTILSKFRRWSTRHICPSWIKEQCYVLVTFEKEEVMNTQNQNLSENQHILLLVGWVGCSESHPLSHIFMDFFSLTCRSKTVRPTRPLLGCPERPKRQPKSWTVTRWEVELDGRGDNDEPPTRN